jgi:ferritin
MLKEKIQEALNKQIVAELYSSYLYLSMEAYFHSINLPGFANWMRVQTQEENAHGLMIFDYVAERGGKIKLGPIEQPPTEWDSPRAVFEAVYKHEQKVTGLINDLVDLAIEEKDHATNNFLQWFVKEQVEEEANADALLQKLKRIGDDGRGLLMLDQELAQRVFKPPVTGE